MEFDKTYKLENDTYFHFHTNEEGYYYSIYDRNGEETDGGLMEYDPDIDEPNESLESVLNRLSSFSGITNLKQAEEIPFDQIEQKDYKDIVSEYAKRNNIKLVEYEGKIIDITEYLYAYPDISEEKIDLSEDNDYFAIYDSYEQFYNENEEYFEEDEELDKEKFIKNFLKEEIDKYCDKKGNYIPEYSENEVAKELNLGDIIIEENIKTKEDFEEYIENNLFNSIYDEFRSEVIDDFKKYLIEKTDINREDVIEYITELEENFWDIIEDDTGYSGNIAFDIDKVLEKINVNVNLLLATGTEKDLEFSSIEKSFKGKVEDKTDMEYVIDNSLTYLVSQQGYKVEDVISSYNENPEGFPSTDYKLPFIESVVDELANLPDYKYSQVVVLQKLNGKELLDLIENKEHEVEALITISKDSMVGLYNNLNGSGSLLEINLDKDFVFPISMIDNIQFEKLSYEKVEEQRRTCRLFYK